MNGNLFEQDQNFETALMNFRSARAVYDELGKYGDLENQVSCQEHVEELDPSIRYTFTRLVNQINKPLNLQVDEMEGPALYIFKAKLEDEKIQKLFDLELRRGDSSTISLSHSHNRLQSQNTTLF